MVVDYFSDFFFAFLFFPFLRGSCHETGLHREDLLNSESEAMEETLRRLPKDVADARDLRVKLALELDFKGEASNW